MDVAAGQQSVGYLLSATHFVRPVLGCLPVSCYDSTIMVMLGVRLAFEREPIPQIYYLSLCVFIYFRQGLRKPRLALNSFYVDEANFELLFLLPPCPGY